MQILISFIIFSFISFSANFVKQTERRGKEEIVLGKIYYISPQHILYQVNQPINQILAYISDTLIIYYPEDKKAFNIINSSPQNLVMRSQTGEINELSDLMNIGYILIKKERCKDTLYYYWVPIDKKRKETIKIGKLQNRMISVNIKTPDITQDIIYLDYIQKDDIFLPTEIYFERTSCTDTFIETTTYSNVDFNPEIPNHIMKFRLPKGIEIKEIKW